MPNVPSPVASRISRIAFRAFAPALLLLALGSCGYGTGQPELRLWTDSFAFRVSFEPVPPRALETIRFRVVVRDKETGQPIEGGEGRIFATNEDRHNIDNGFTAGPEVGTYHTTLFFVNAGPWAMGIQFRRDSTQRLQRTNDWMQDVFPDSGPPS
ncbi:MAG: hypothetical protein ACT4R6_02280 [Gemmatimonadaceae bacterium]